jgi:spermidine/putrescine transport system permease protein
MQGRSRWGRPFSLHLPSGQAGLHAFVVDLSVKPRKHGQKPEQQGQDMAGTSRISAEGRRSLWLLLPPFAYAFLLMAIPLGAVVIISFTGDNGFTLGNYGTVFTEPINVTGVVRDGGWIPGLLPRSIFVSIAVTAATVILAYPIAYFISFHVSPSRKSLWLLLITIPFWTSYLIRIFLWKVILGFSGVVNTALMGLGLIDEPLTAINYNVTAVVITLSHAYAPFAILPIFVSLEKIERSLLEASQDLGETKFTTFLRVTLPLSVPGIVAAVLIVFIPTIGDYVTPELVGGSGGLLIANRIQSLFLQVDDPGLGSALSLVTMAAVGLVAMTFMLLMRRWLRAR